MRVIENPKDKEKRTSLNRLDEMISSLRLGKGWSQDMKAQDGVVSALEKLLDNKYVLLCNVELEGLDVPIPLVLVGPTGVRVLYPSAARGVFRARGDVWEQLENNQQVFRPATPNLLARAILIARAVAAFLVGREMPMPEIEPVLIFVDPGTHVDAVRPEVRVLTMDGLERYLSGIVQSRAFLDKEDVQKIVNLFMHSMGHPGEGEGAAPEHDAFSFTDEGERPSSTILDRLPRGERMVSTLNKIPFSTRQWVLLGLMVIVNILILVGFVLLILLTS